MKSVGSVSLGAVEMYWVTQHEIIMRIFSRLLFLNYASQELQPNLCNIKPSPKGTDFSNHFFGGEGCGLI